MRRRIFIILSVAWMLTIFIASSRDSVQSTNDSDPLVEAVVQFFVPGFQQMDQGMQNRTWHVAEIFTRKSAHMAEYALLAVLLVPALQSVPGAGAAAVLYAVSDEIHQRFVPGRFGSATDVAVDAAGAAMGLLLVLLYRRIRRRRSVV